MKELLRLMRPSQWIKNGFVFMPLVFSVRLWVVEDVFKVTAICLSFCLASAATYILNDYVDMERDRAHPTKRRRPLAAGTVTPGSALTVMVLAAAAAFLIAYLIGAPLVCHGFLLSYLALQLAYSFKLKNIVILDVLSISTGFLLRVLGGATIIGVHVSSWLILCTFSLAILLALGKRRNEILVLTEEAIAHRPVLENYNVGLLDQLLQVVTTSTFVFYCLYSVTGNPAMGIESERMMFTIPLVTYGIFRYMYLVYHLDSGGSPTDMLLNDPPLLSCTILWLAACVLIIYVRSGV
ncbi:MAG: decaprenyl-phosphate phosphoribosyltransferase [Pseudomonadota bacterium]